MSEEIFCIKCKHNWQGFCENESLLEEVKTPYRIEKVFPLEKEQNANNDCRYFEPIVWNPTRFEKVMIRLNKFFGRNW